MMMNITGHPQRIGRYKILRVLGTGAMGHVYAAWDPKLYREVALKLVPAHLSCQAKGRERFQREARAIAAMRHPNIVEIYDYSGPEAEHLYLVIEKLQGPDLYTLLQRQGPLPEEVAVAVGHELCLALEVAHEAGMIHRDLKPENVFLNPGGRMVLTDFGIVKAIRADSVVEGYQEDTDVIGTPGFMAPELMRGGDWSPAVDMFALGVLLYNLTTSQLPFEGASPLAIFQAAARGCYEDPRRYEPGLSQDFCKIVAQCLQPLPKKRPQHAEPVRRRLKAILYNLDRVDAREVLRDYLAPTCIIQGRGRGRRTSSHRPASHARAPQTQQLAFLSREPWPWGQRPVYQVLVAAGQTCLQWIQKWLRLPPKLGIGLKSRFKIKGSSYQKSSWMAAGLTVTALMGLRLLQHPQHAQTGDEKVQSPAQMQMGPVASEKLGGGGHRPVLRSAPGVPHPLLLQGSRPPLNPLPAMKAIRLETAPGGAPLQRKTSVGTSAALLGPAPKSVRLGGHTGPPRKPLRARPPLQ